MSNNAMNENQSFAASLVGWATLPDAAVEAVETWKAAAAIVTDSPVGGLRSDAYAGTLTAKNVAKRLTEAGQLVAAQVIAPQLVEELAGPLAQRFADAVLADSDRIIAELAVTFDRYAAKVAEYAPLVPAGATADELLATAGAPVLDAWQILGAAEATLEQVAQFRLQLSTRFAYPAPTPSIAAWIAPVSNADELQRASLAWRGHQPIGAVDAGMTTPLPEVRGGRWRWLIDAGFELRINTADQAAAVTAVLAPVAA